MSDTKWIFSKIVQACRWSAAVASIKHIVKCSYKYPSYYYKYPASAGAAPGAVTNAAVLAALFGHWKWPQVKLVFRRIISREVPVQSSAGSRWVSCEGESGNECLKTGD